MENEGSQIILSTEGVGIGEDIQTGNEGAPHHLACGAVGHRDGWNYFK